MPPGSDGRRRAWRATAGRWPWPAGCAVRPPSGSRSPVRGRPSSRSRRSRWRGRGRRRRERGRDRARTARRRPRAAPAAGGRDRCPTVPRSRRRVAEVAAPVRAGAGAPGSRCCPARSRGARPAGRDRPNRWRRRATRDRPRWAAGTCRTGTCGSARRHRARRSARCGAPTTPSRSTARRDPRCAGGARARRGRRWPPRSWPAPDHRRWPRRRRTGRRPPGRPRR